MASKKRRYPKAPRKTASVQVWENYRNRCKDVDKHNASLISDKKKKEGIIKSVQQLKSKR